MADPLTKLFSLLDRLKWWWEGRHERRKYKAMCRRMDYHRKRVHRSLKELENCELPHWLKAKPKDGTKE